MWQFQEQRTQQAFLENEAAERETERKLAKAKAKVDEEEEEEEESCILGVRMKSNFRVLDQCPALLPFF